jgi:anaerobic ribonucleoside-triphosphate reductase activating protein
MIRYHEYSVEEKELLYGPGKRLVLWVMGCSLRCDGCINSHLWDPNGGKIISVNELVGLCSPTEIEGITLLGGEPADQAEKLLPALKTIKELGKSIVFFTGYEIEELITTPQKKILDLSDIIICGRFDKSKLNYFLHFRGSSNQQVILNSERYKNYKIKDGHNTVVVSISDKGEVVCKGIPDEEMKSFVMGKSNL